MKNIKMQILTLIAAIILILAAISITYKTTEKKPEEKEPISKPVVLKLDQSSILPDWRDGEYHDYDKTVHQLNLFNDKYSDLVDVFSIGQSVKNREIWCIRLTNEKNNEDKYSCLIDGCIHGNEWESGDACLYLAEYLLINFGDNKTITHILNTTEIYIVPLLNPDGRENDDRFNDNGIDLNRNFDVDFGRLIGDSLRIGKLFGRIRIPYIKVPFIEYYIPNCGRVPFSEPESQALRDLMKSLNYHKLAFYVNCHTATHNVVTPWLVFKQPFKMTSQEGDLFEHVKKWVEENTEYNAFEKGKNFYRSGEAMDWCYKELRKPSFIFELLSFDYDPGFTDGGKHDHLVHWMKTSLPFFMYLLVNIENLYNWEITDNQPPLPDGVPPSPLS